MTELPPELVRLTQLFSNMVSMNFDYNRLSVLPKEVGKLTNLTRLSFNRNRYAAQLQSCLCAPQEVRDVSQPRGVVCMSACACTDGVWCHVISPRASLTFVPCFFSSVSS